MRAAVVLSFFFASALALEFAPVPDGDPSIQVVRNIITRANYYLEDHLMTEMKMPNIGGPWPVDVVSLTDGKIGEFDTLALQGNPDIQKRENSDGSTTYLFDVKMDLEQLTMNYHFKVKLIGFIIRDGTVDLIPGQNTLGAKGIVVVRKDGRCDAGFYGFSVDKLDDIKVVIQPQDIPGLGFISETILNFVTPRIIPVTNLALNGATLSQTFQSSFSNFVCKEFNHPTEVPSTPEPTKEPTEEPKPNTTVEPTEAPTEGPSPNTNDVPTDAPTEVPNTADESEEDQQV